MVVRGPSPHLRPDPTAFLVREHLGLPQEPQRKNSRSLGVSSRGCTMPASGGRRCWGRAGRSWSYQTPASDRPTVWLEVMALVASTCGYNVSFRQASLTSLLESVTSALQGIIRRWDLDAGGGRRVSTPQTAQTPPSSQAQPRRGLGAT